MHSDMIGKIDKAHRYAADRDRFDFESLAVTVHGNNDDHRVQFADGRWRCECDFFANRGACAHTMALEVMLDGMVHASVEEARAAS